MRKIFVGLCALFFTAPLLAGPVPSQKLDEIQQTIQNNVNAVVKNFDVNKLTEKPQRDLLTLVIGGVAGFATGGMISHLGLLRIEALGVSVIPVASGLAGIYLANEGYFDKLRGMVSGKP